MPALGLTLLAFLTEVVALDFSMRSVAVDVSYPILLLGYLLPTLLARFVPVPGGLGVTEAGMVTFFSTLSPAGTYRLTIAVLIFRISAVFFLALVGAAVYYAMWNGSEEATAEPT